VPSRRPSTKHPPPSSPLSQEFEYPCGPITRFFPTSSISASSWSMVSKNLWMSISPPPPYRCVREPVPPMRRITFQRVGGALLSARNPYEAALGSRPRRLVRPTEGLRRRRLHHNGRAPWEYPQRPAASPSGFGNVLGRLTGFAASTKPVAEGVVVSPLETVSTGPPARSSNRRLAVDQPAAPLVSPF